MAPDYADQINLMIEFIVAGLIAVAFVVAAFLSLRERHRQGDGWHVYVGAAIYGLIFGVVVGFVLVPLRIAMLNGEMPTEQMAIAGPVVLLIVIALRRGLIGRLPFLGPQVRAYRRATLRRVIEVSQNQLDKITPNSAETA